MVLISVIMPTARHDYPLIGLPRIHILEPTLGSLKKQTFRDFELIIVDALYERRPRLFQGEPFRDDHLPFPVKHVPVHPNHRFWLNRKRWAVCGALNTAILHAEGELIVRIDDCSELPDPDYLKKFWEGYECGYFPMAMHIRYLGGQPARLDKKYLELGYELQRPFLYQRLEDEVEDRAEILKRVYGEEGLIRDSRYQTIVKRGGRIIAPVNWYYGYSCVSLEAALKINGYDELFDGDKSIEDIDFGSRLEMAGYKNMFLLDVNLQVIEHEHEPIPADVIARDIKPIKCNYALYLLNRKKRRWRANSDKLTEEDLEFVRQESLKPPCSPRPHYYDEDCRGELFRIWAENQPIFDLREERLEV